MAALIFLTYLVIILLLGIVSSILAKKLKIPNVLILLFVGIFLNNYKYGGQSLISFPTEFITSISILALVMIIFDSSSRFKVRQIDAISGRAAKLTIIFLLSNLLLLAFAHNIIYKPQSVLLSFLFAAVMSGTSPDTVLSMFKNLKNKVTQLLGVESIINTPLMVLIPFLLIDLMLSVEGNFTISIFLEQFRPFALQILTGIGTGVVVGLIIFKTMKKQYSEEISPLALIAAALLTYILSENLGGNGVLAVTVAGVMFGAFYVKEKKHLMEFSLIFSNFLEILVFIFVGLLIEIPFNLMFFVKSGGLFLIYVLIRFVSVEMSLPGTKDFTFKEKLFITLNMPKGIAVAVVASTLLIYTVPGAANFIPGLNLLLDIVLIFLIYSIVLSTIVIKFANYFIQLEVK